MDTSLQDLGFGPFFAQQTSLEEIELARVGRVVEIQRSAITVSDGVHERSICVPSSWHSEVPEQRPTVGDWIVLDSQHVRIERILDRKSALRRLAAGEKTKVQIIAANIDVLLIVTSCNEEFNESRLERYLSAATEAGVLPVIVLTKTDLADDAASYIARARSVQSGVIVESVNALDRRTFDGVTAWIESGNTVALVGSSGVGKSTILNTLSHANTAATNEIRWDDKKGRHTTTHRELYRLPGGGLLIDVPGMREFKLAADDESLGAVFKDIETIASACRFANCLHQSEPGCAVRLAVENGELDARRLRNYIKLLAENERHNASLAEKRSQGRAFSKLVKQAVSLKSSHGKKP